MKSGLFVNVCHYQQMSQEKKQRAARAALEFIEDDMVVGIGSGSTVNCFIEELAHIRHRIDGAVASSVATETRLRQHKIPIIDLNSVTELSVYIDGADEATRHLQLTKGGGGALTQEKITAAVSDRFICIVDDTKMVDVLGTFPLPVEVIPMARSYVGREIVKLGGQPLLRENFITDNTNVILDVHNLSIVNPVELEQQLNQIVGVVTSGLFARRRADLLLVADERQVTQLSQS